MFVVFGGKDFLCFPIGSGRHCSHCAHRITQMTPLPSESTLHSGCHSNMHFATASFVVVQRPYLEDT